jgi:hypothetical protein
MIPLYPSMADLPQSTVVHGPSTDCNKKCMSYQVDGRPSEDQGLPARIYGIPSSQYGIPLSIDGIPSPWGSANSLTFGGMPSPYDMHPPLMAGALPTARVLPSIARV